MKVNYYYLSAFVIISLIISISIYFLVNVQINCPDGYVVENAQCLLPSRDISTDITLDNDLTEFLVTKPNIWDNGIVPYIIDSKLGFDERLKITNAIEEYHKYTKIKFVQQTNEKSYIVFTPSEDPNLCASQIGRRGGWQKIMIGNKCTTEIIVHELMHGLGWYHEHARMDRDKHVEILYENIIESEKLNFDKFTDFVWEKIEQFTKYDYASIMNYGPKDFSANGKNTIKPKINTDLKKLNTFSEIDKIELDMYYTLSQKK